MNEIELLMEELFMDPLKIRKLKSVVGIGEVLKRD